MFHCHFVEEKSERIVFCGKEYKAIISSSHVLPMEIAPPNGYDPNTIEGKPYPFCCNKHKAQLDRVEKLFKLFPNCCEKHKKLKEQKWFKKSDYRNVALHVMNTVGYISEVIKTNVHENDWYERITDYMTICIFSLGHFPKGFGGPLGAGPFLEYLSHNLSCPTCMEPIELSEEKGKKLLAYLDDIKPIKEEEEINLQELFTIYEKWLDSFPFSISSYFNGLRGQLESTFPFLTHNPKINPNLHLPLFQLKNTVALYQTLIGKTKEILSRIDPQELLKKGKINNVNAHYLELENESFRIDNQLITDELNSGETAYIETLQKWLQRQVVHFERIKPHIKPPPKPANKKHIYNTLEDMWLPDSSGSKKHYLEVLDALKKEYNEIGGPFIKEINGSLNWNKTPQKGWAQYLAAFVQTCQKNGWIQDVHSAPMYRSVLCRTFNISSLDPKPFRSLSVNVFNDEYTAPFKKLIPKNM